MQGSGTEKSWFGAAVGEVGLTNEGCGESSECHSEGHSEALLCPGLLSEPEAFPSPCF